MDAIIQWIQHHLLNGLALFGFAAQFIFMSRFVVQWYESEKRKRSTVPVSFWYLSLVGGLMLGVYAAIREDPVIFLGQVLGVSIYTRNLVLIYRRRARIRTRQRERQAAAVILPDETLPDANGTIDTTPEESEQT